MDTEVDMDAALGMDVLSSRLRFLMQLDIHTIHVVLACAFIAIVVLTGLILVPTHGN